MVVEYLEEGEKSQWVAPRCPLCGKTFQGKRANESLASHLEWEHAEELAALDRALGPRFNGGPAPRPNKVGAGTNKTAQIILRDVEERILEGDAKAAARHWEAYTWRWSSPSSSQVKRFLERCSQLHRGEILPGELRRGE